MLHHMRGVIPHASCYTTCVVLYYMRHVTPHAWCYTTCVMLHHMRGVIPHASCYVACVVHMLSHLHIAESLPHAWAVAVSLLTGVSVFRGSKQGCLCLKTSACLCSERQQRDSKRPSICLSLEHQRHHCVATLRPCVTLAQIAMQIAMLQMRRHSLVYRLFLYPLISDRLFLDRLFVYRLFLLSKGGF